MKGKYFIGAFLWIVLLEVSGNTTQVVTPGIYQPPGQIQGCDEKTLSEQIIQRCNAMMKKAGNIFASQNEIVWETEKLSHSICKGLSPHVGQLITYSVMGNVKPCPGNTTVPMFEGWNCDISVDTRFNVEVQYLYYSTCVG